MRVGMDSALYGGVSRASFGVQGGRGRTAAQPSGAGFGAPVQRVDKVSINGRSGLSKVLDGLMQQKANILEQRENLVNSTLQKGGSIENIKDQLDGYQEKLAEIEQQMVEAMANDAKKLLEDNSEQKVEKPQTEEEAAQADLNKISALSAQYKQAQTVASVKNRTESSARILESEIKLDGGRGADVSKKQDKLLDLRRKASNLSGEFQHRMAVITEKANSAGPQPVQGAEKNTEAESEAPALPNSGAEPAPQPEEPVAV